MAEKLGLSRNSIWKAVKKLKEEGYQIESQTNSGYILRNFNEPLNATRISSLMKEDSEIKLVVLDEIPSTNSYIKENPGLDDLTAVITNSQSKGRGRLGRTFYSPKGSGIYLSLLIKKPQEKYDISYLTMTSAVALYEALKPNLKGNLGVKWVNDIYLNGKKMAGILTESETELESLTVRQAIIGMGINVLTDSFPEEIKETATSLLIEEKKSFDRNILIADILRSLESNLSLLKKDKSKITEKYNEYLILKGERVKINAFSRIFEAIIKGINENGNLIVEEDGKELTIMSGEILFNKSTDRLDRASWT